VVAALAALASAPPHSGGALDVGERLREAIEDATLPGADGVSVTVSVGVAAHPSAGDPEELVREADKALYLAKRLGKNRVEVFVG
jgi:diguanylate cyclase (GGDEF)-like protein